MTGHKRPLPPTAAESPVARRVLVLAPHYDDEVLGCGGLILQLAAAGAKIVCAFMSDGSGGVEGPPEGSTREQYSKRRKEEADEAVAALGIDSVEHLGHRHGLQDGALASSLEQLTSHLESLLQDHQPDLLLAPSPLEVTPDHQATFRALHEALINRRRGRTEGGEELASQDDDSSVGDLALRVLCYEVNHPFYPDLLVDVTAELDEVVDAMSHYRSQLERHDYMGSCRGLRRYRSLTLPDSCRYAEGYCQLTASDFTTRSPAQLIAYLGGAPSLVAVTSPRRVSIVVRTYNRPRRLAEALNSLALSTYRNVEVVLVNDGGRRPEVAEDFPFEVRRVDFAENRGRSAAAQAGVEAATGDCVGFLDDDDLLAPEHLESLTAMLRDGVDVAYSDAAVVCYEPSTSGWRESSRRLPYSRDFDRTILLLDNYIPFHTVLMTREALERAGSFDLQLPIFEDWDLLIRVSRSSSFVHLARTTCEYRHFLDGAADDPSGGHALGGAASARPDFETLKAKVLSKHATDLGPDALARAVTRMRRQAVLAGEAARAQIRERQRDLEQARARERERGVEIERLQVRERELESSHSDLGAEIERLQVRERELESSHSDLGAEIERLQDRERELESSHSDLGAEIERLQDRERELESSHSDLGAEIERLQDRERELESSHSDLGAEIERLQVRERELESSHSDLGAEIERLQDRERELESSHSDLGAEIERLQDRERELESSHSDLGAEIERLQDRERELESSHSDLGAEIERLQDRERELESSHSDLGAEIERLQDRERELESSHSERGAEIERLQARERELESSHSRLGTEIKRLQTLEEKHVAELHRLHGRERDMQAEVEAMKATRAWRLRERLQTLRGTDD